MDIKIGETILRALRNGTVPNVGTHLLIAGNKEERRHLNNELEYISFDNDGHAGFKFLYGPYGSGKSFLCEVLKEDALENNYAVSEIVISKSVQLQNFETVYQAIMTGLRTKNQREYSAFRQVIQEWLSKEKKDIIRKYDLDPDERDEDEEQLMNLLEQKISDELSKANATSPGIVQAFHSFYKGLMEGDRQLSDWAIGWIAGDASIDRVAKSKIGVTGKVDKTNAFEFLLALLHILKLSGYKGLLIIIDEVETVRKERRDIRYQAFENLRFLIDMVSKDRLKGCYMLFTGTDDLIENEDRSIKEHDALFSRIKPLSLQRKEGIKKVFSTPLLKLNRFSTNQLVEVAHKVRQIHGEVHDWLPEMVIDDAFIKQYVESFTIAFDREVSVLPRTFLREFLFVLDAAKEGNDVHSLLNINPEVVQRVKHNFEVAGGRETAVDIEL
ncbi:BREX system ATP-binding domain-containing protein [Sporosarcina sp. USHLN248]|uniref:BREX system ATP-binding domain-containing protein n=1 Tax=Sporosarcina sp. USHLN248 TaxID=3081300 RepID=UPI00301A9869